MHPRARGCHIVSYPGCGAPDGGGIGGARVKVGRKRRWLATIEASGGSS